MTDGQWLFTLFALLYLAECLRWRSGAVWLFHGSSREGAFRLPLRHLEYAGGHPLLLPVLPPFHVHRALMTWTLVPTTEGLEMLDAEGRSLALLNWVKIQPALDGCRLKLTPGQALLLPSEACGQAWCLRVEGWLKMSAEARRESFFRYAEQTLSLEQFEADLKELTRKTKSLRLLGLFIFVTCFIVITSVYRILGEGWILMAAVSVMFALMWTQAFLFWHVAGSLPDRHVKHRFWKALAIALLPQNGMRAADHLCEALFTESHPLAAIGALAKPQKLKLLRSFWKVIHHSQAQSAALQQQALLAFLKANQISEDQMEVVPEKQPESVAYCPRCQSQFREASALCKDCGGVSLKTFPGAD